MLCGKVIGVMTALLLFIVKILCSLTPKMFLIFVNSDPLSGRRGGCEVSAINTPCWGGALMPKERDADYQKLLPVQLFKNRKS
mgnify:CR=1